MFKLMDEYNKRLVCDYSQMSDEAAFEDILTNMEEDKGNVIHLLNKETIGAFELSRLKLEMNIHVDEVLSTIHRWRTAKKSRLERILSHHQAPEYRVYTSRVNAARALIAEVLSQKNLKHEDVLARKILDNPFIRAEIASAIMAVKRVYGPRMTDKPPKTLDDFIRSGHSGVYKFYYGFFSPGKEFTGVFTNPYRYSVGKLIAVLHDAMDLYSRQMGAVAVNVSSKEIRPKEARGPGTHIVRQKIGGTAQFRRKDPKRKLRGIATIESRGSIQTARKYNMPVSAGPSFTTARMLTMCEKSGCNVQQLESVALGLFAFWNDVYNKSATSVHRYHFVMDMAKNFGVEYTPGKYIFAG